MLSAIEGLLLLNAYSCYAHQSSADKRNQDLTVSWAKKGHHLVSWEEMELLDGSIMFFGFLSILRRPSVQRFQSRKQFPKRGGKVWVHHDKKGYKLEGVSGKRQGKRSEGRSNGRGGEEAFRNSCPLPRSLCLRILSSYTNIIRVLMELVLFQFLDHQR
jgi:hypothetical protein